MIFIYFLLIILITKPVISFWDFASTTLALERTDVFERTSFFKWPRVQYASSFFWVGEVFDEVENSYKRRACVVVGLSIDMLPLSTGILLNSRIVLSSANYFEPYMYRQRDFRVWALGRAGQCNTPYRYRVFKVVRLFPKSLNPEHQHGPRGGHCPRHDLAVVIVMDQMYLFKSPSFRFMYTFKAKLIGPHEILIDDLWFVGSGYEYIEHIYENYKIYYSHSKKHDIVDCSKYLPKYWGKFICIKNVQSFSGLQNGGGLFSGDKLVGIGCFEIRYNEDRILVFTDIRYYIFWIYRYANLTRGQYYEYAYPQWSIKREILYDGGSNYPYIPLFQIRDDLFPLG